MSQDGFLKFAEVSEASSGLNASKTLQFNVSNDFNWIDEPISQIGYIYPTDTTYHPLVYQSNYEIAQNLFTIQGSNLSPEDKNKYTNKVKKIVEKSTYVRSMGSVYFTFLILAIITLIAIMFGFANKTPFIIIAFIMLFYIGANFVYAQTMADGVGKTIWFDFINTYNSLNNSGKTAAAILQELKNDNVREEEHLRQMQYNSNNMRNKNTASNGFLGAFLGSLLAAKK